MIHNIDSLVKRLTLLKQEEMRKGQKEALNDLYILVDEYNDFIRKMDIKFDNVIIKLEGLVDNGN